ncbi:MAG: alpha-acetolactate decarboxylase [Microbacteriaceae bacterium]|nr:alpha-acetolactate decarboxylase [Microbacteriaceae bacterium]
MPGAAQSRRRVFQSSLMSALLAGVYDGDLTVSQLLEHGDFGLGTFDALDGEMVVIDGVCFRMRADGSVTPAAPTDVTPFAVVLDFEPDVTMEVTEPMDMKILFDRVGAESDNYLYAVRVTGSFSTITTRTVSVQRHPYPPLRQAVRGQAVMTFENVSGTIAGFESPLYERGIGVPGGHVHFISDDRSQGGHVLDFRMLSGSIEVCIGTDLDLRLPLSREFGSADLDPADLDAQIEATENHHANE